MPVAHIQDRWETVGDGRRTRTDRYGQGKRWRARYEDPNGNERSQMFARKQDAERFLTSVSPTYFAVPTSTRPLAGSPPSG